MWKLLDVAVNTMALCVHAVLPQLSPPLQTLKLDAKGRLYGGSAALAPLVRLSRLDLKLQYPPAVPETLTALTRLSLANHSDTSFKFRDDGKLNARAAFTSNFSKLVALKVGL
jgi:hypothetical protein